MKAYITVGVSASGKTTWARQHARETGAILSNRDDLRFSLTGADHWSEYGFHKDIETLINEIQRTTLVHAAARRRDIICGDTNLNKFLRERLIADCELYGYEVIVKGFPITLEEAIKRDAARQFSVGESILKKQYKQWEEFLLE